MASFFQQLAQRRQDATPYAAPQDGPKDDFLSPRTPRDPNLSFSRDFKNLIKKVRGVAHKTKRWATSSSVQGPSSLELPNELILAVIDQVDDPETLRNLRLTARVCKEAAAQKLFATVSKPFTHHGLADLLNLANGRNKAFIRSLIIHEPDYLSTPLVSAAQVRELWLRAIRGRYLVMPAKIVTECLPNLSNLHFDFNKIGHGLLLNGGTFRAWHYLSQKTGLWVRVSIKSRPTKRWRTIVNGINTQIAPGLGLCYEICENDSLHKHAQRKTLVLGDIITCLLVNGRPGRWVHDLSFSGRTSRIIKLQSLDLTNITIPSWEIADIMIASMGTLKYLRLHHVTIEDDQFRPIFNALRICWQMDEVDLLELSVAEDRMHQCLYLDDLNERALSSATMMDHISLVSTLQSLDDIRRQSDDRLLMNGACLELLARSETPNWI